MSEPSAGADRDQGAHNPDQDSEPPDDGIPGPVHTEQPAEGPDEDAVGT